MLNIIKTKRDDAVIIALEGRLDTAAASELQAVVDGVIDSAAEFVFDFTKLKYLSSAGLRVLLTTQQAMEETRRPDVTVTGSNADIRGVFKITGFDNVLNIK